MKCLILAAGYGSRLREVSPCKPLTPVRGVPLIEHVIRRASCAGATDFTIVTGHEAERLEAFISQLRSSEGLALQWVRTPNWDRPNGVSLLAGADLIEGDYLLLMSDHLVDPEIPSGLLASARGKAGVTLAVDRALEGPLLDIEDATKVEVGASGEIVRIGKSLDHYNAIDTGVFLATPALARGIRDDLAAGGGGSLSEGVQRLADQRIAFTHDATGSRWIDVDDPRTLVLAETLLEQEPQPLASRVG